MPKLSDRGNIIPITSPEKPEIKVAVPPLDISGISAMLVEQQTQLITALARINAVHSKTVVSALEAQTKAIEALTAEVQKANKASSAEWTFDIVRDDSNRSKSIKAKKVK